MLKPLLHSLPKIQFWLTLALAAILTSLPGIARTNEAKDYPSPDGRFVAQVIQLPIVPYGSGESRIVIHSIKGRVLYSKDYSSWDGEHGYGVEKATWTPDSNFFVFSLSSSGGHSAWHSPIEFVSVRKAKLYSLDDLVGPITDPEFEVGAPDVVRATGRKKTNLTEEVHFEIRLSRIMRQRN
jgi:hypothetical protein